MRYVIAGNGATAVMAADALVKEEPGSTIEIYGDESYLAYRRPQIPAFLAGEVELERMLMHSQAWYDERGIAVHRDAHVEALDPGAGQIHLAGGEKVPYDRLLLAVGSRSFVPPIMGTDQPGVFTLRTVEDAMAIREYAQNRRRAVVIGGGLLGLEAARSLRALGLEVTVLEVYGWLLPRQLDRPGAEILTGIIEGMGIHVLTGAALECVSEKECVSGVRLKDGRGLEAEVVLISTGVRCRLELAREAGLEVNRGVVVDGHLRSSAEGIYAAGDVAEFEGRVYGILPAVWDQAPIAAANMAGREAVYTGTIPSTTLKVVGLDLTSVGEVNPEGEAFEELRRSEPEAARYVKVVLRDGRLVGAILLGDRRRVRMFKGLIDKEADVSTYAERLLDADFTEVPQ